MHGAYITQIGQCLPNQARGNEEIEDYLGRVNGKASKVKHRILKSNGIQQRYYALDRQQNPTHLNHQMAAIAIRDALSHSDLEPAAFDLLCAATTWPDLLVPGFASMVHGELAELPSLEATSHQGVCCAGIAALNYAASQIALGQRRNAIAVASELASRLFKHTQFEAQTAVQAGKPLAFDTEFLRWMLSDGAGALILRDRPNAKGLSLKIEWIELISHASAYPVCMYAGTADDTATQSWMDYPTYSAAAQAGAINLRQNIRLLDNVIKLGVEGWLRLIDLGRVQPDQIDWLLCHYSSHFFRSQIVELLEKANCMVPEEKWFTNLYTRGNTGCASIYLMLEELFHSGKLQPGQQIFCFVPESGRFTTAYMMLTVVEGGEKGQWEDAETRRHGEEGESSVYGGKRQALASVDCNLNAEPSITTKPSTDIPTDSLFSSSSPSLPAPPPPPLLRDLTLTWLDFERRLQAVPIVRRLNRGEFTLADYQALLRNLRPQVVEGARWIARAASNMTDFRLRSLFIGHAQDEHRDFQMLERNYVSVGGDLAEIVAAEKNIGSEALSAFIFHRASQENPIDLVGSMFIIEGLGNRLAGKWAEQIQQSLRLSREQVSFLAYHSDNDESHIGKIDSILQANWMTPAIAQRIVKTAQVTARLYLLQLEEIE
ncbi:MAG: beta-ketoacyl-ACP synthase III [Leptolyngbya sp. SIO4C5]|nr:beta-ketoacyl-ACP synthase III [Leptolyngbya sp. SIO4C5]